MRFVCFVDLSPNTWNIAHRREHRRKVYSTQPMYHCVRNLFVSKSHTHINFIHRIGHPESNRRNERRLIIFIQRTTSDTNNFMPLGNNHHFVHIDVTWWSIKSKRAPFVLCNLAICGERKREIARNNVEKNGKYLLLLHIQQLFIHFVAKNNDRGHEK